jgi:hypothetical protein
MKRKLESSSLDQGKSVVEVQRDFLNMSAQLVNEGEYT